jgi:hypothetical protein
MEGRNMGDLDIKGDYCYVVRGGGCWGKGFTERQAVSAWRDAGGRGKRRGRDYEVHRIELSAQVYVDFNGTAHHVPANGAKDRAVFERVESEEGGATFSAKTK